MSPFPASFLGSFLAGVVVAKFSSRLREGKSERVFSVGLEEEGCVPSPSSLLLVGVWWGSLERNLVPGTTFTLPLPLPSTSPTLST